MSVTTVVKSNTGTLVAICAVIPDTYDQAGYESTDLVFTEIGEIETVGAHGVERQIVTFTPVADGVIAKMSGSKDYGNMDLTIGNLPGDAGQALLKTASESNNHYSVKITYPTGSGESTPAVHYLDVIVSKFSFVGGGANDVDKVNSTFAVCRAPVVIAAT